jgi:hypothetical protein
LAGELLRERSTNDSSSILEVSMFDQLFDGFRKASESSIVAQQEMIKQWVQQWPTASLSAAGSAIERNSEFHKRWVESATSTLTRQRELLDNACKSGVQLIEQAARLSDARSPDDFRKLMEELWRKMFQGMKDQSEAQFVELKNASEALLTAVQVPDKVAG